MDLSYLILDSHCMQSKHNAVLFDMGCASFHSMQTTKASGNKDSIPLLINMYKKSCIAFEKIWAWESRKYNNWWRNVPHSLQSSVSFFNEAMNASSFETALLTTSVHDYVVVKLDIDNTIAEMTIIDVIIEHSKLVDVL